MIDIVNRLAADAVAHSESTAVVHVTESPPASAGFLSEQANLVRQSFSRIHAEFELENDLLLVYPLTEEIQQMATRAYGDYDDSYRFQLAISLEEALTNAIVHGNLEISSVLRANAEEVYERLVKERPNQPPYDQRRVHVEVTLDREQLLLLIRDQGPGFNVSQVPDPTAPENIEKVCGRGLALMRSFMDAVVHNSRGNSVTMVKGAPKIVPQ